MDLRAVRREVALEHHIPVVSEIKEPERVESRVPRALIDKIQPAPSIGDTGQIGPRRGLKGQDIYPVWFGTNRKPIDNINPMAGYTNQHSDVLSFGRVEVMVPKAHRFGEIGSGFWSKFRRFDFRDDRLSIEQMIPLSASGLWAEIRRQIQDARIAGDPPRALLFLHGYNCGFDDAAIRSAQIGFDLKIPATAFFSWPSRGTVLGYAADEASIEASESSITDFIINFSRECGTEEIHIIAHSMGNRGLLRSLQRITKEAETRGTVHFGQIFLAAPDVDRRLFLGLAHVFEDFCDRATLYSSSADLAVYLSTLFHSAPRAGYFLPYTIAKGIDSIAVPSFNLDLLGHGYFAQAEALLHDMYDLIRRDAPPSQRQRIESLLSGQESLWQIRR